MTLNILTEEDLKRTGLDKNFEWAEQISTQPKIAQNLRYFDILAAAGI